MAIIKIDKGNFYLVRSDSNKKIKVKGDKHIYSEATELKDKPREYEEVEEWLNPLKVVIRFIVKVENH